MLKQFLSWQFIGFVIAGLVAALLHWLARLFLSQWISFPVAVFLAYGVGMLVAFILNSILVFPNSAEPVPTQARRFVLINLAFLPVVWGASLLFVAALNHLGVENFVEEIAHAFAIAIPVFATFLLYKFYAFRSEKYG